MQYYLPKYADRLYKFTYEYSNNKGNTENRLINKKYIKYYFENERFNKDISHKIKKIILTFFNNGYSSFDKILLRKFPKLNDIIIEIYDCAYKRVFEIFEFEYKCAFEIYTNETQSFNNLDGINSKLLFKIIERIIKKYRVNNNFIFRYICQKGYLQIAKKLFRKYPDINFHSEINDIFSDVCHDGYLQIAKWLIKKFPEIDFHAGDDEIFNYVCYGGYLKTAKWLFKKYPDIDIHNINAAFRYACRHGHLTTAKWLVKKYPDIDIYYSDNSAFRHACGNGHLSVAKWLVKKYPKINIHASDDNAFRYACGNGHLSVAKWLVKKYPKINIHTYDDYAFRNACENGHLLVAKWLVKMYNIKNLILPNIHFNYYNRITIKMINFLNKFLPHCINKYYILEQLYLLGNLTETKWIIKKFPEIENNIEHMFVDFYLPKSEKYPYIIKWLLHKYPKLWKILL